MAEARVRLAGAKASLASGFPPLALSAAYYAMLYAARAALSEEDRYSKTHRGTWRLFGQTFVETGRYDRALLDDARNVLPLRLGADYEASPIEPEEAVSVVELAERFVDAVEALYPS